MRFFLLLNTKEDILKHIGNQTVVCFSYYGSQWGPTVWLTIFFKISSFVFSRRKKFIQHWNKLMVNIFLFGLAIPLRDVYSKFVIPVFYHFIAYFFLYKFALLFNRIDKTVFKYFFLLAKKGRTLVNKLVN